MKRLTPAGGMMETNSAQQPVLLALPAIWMQRLDALSFAYQAILDRDSETVFGVEALLRGVELAGFESIQAVFNQAYKDSVLHAVDLALRYKALRDCRAWLINSNCRLFYNLDARCVNDPNHEPGRTAAMMRALGVPSGCVYLEISEQHELLPRQDLDHLISAYRSQGYHIALDDYGVGFGHMRALFLANPELVKIDRFFFQGIERDAKRQLFVRRLTEFAHEIGAKVVAEALETEEAVTSALSLGVDYLQGFVLHRPSQSIHRDLVVDGHRIRLARRRGGRRRSALTRELRC